MANKTVDQCLEDMKTLMVCMNLKCKHLHKVTQHGHGHSSIKSWTEHKAECPRNPRNIAASVVLNPDHHVTYDATAREFRIHDVNDHKLLYILDTTFPGWYNRLQKDRMYRGREDDPLYLTIGEVLTFMRRNRHLKKVFEALT